MLAVDLSVENDWIGRVLGVAPSGQAAPSADAGSPRMPGFVKLQKARLSWDSARKQVTAEIATFRTAVATFFKGDEAEDDVLDGLDELDAITLSFDERVIDILDEMLDERAAEPDRAALLAEARSILAEYEAFAASDPVFTTIDGETPFGVTLRANATMTAAMKDLRAALA